MGAQMKDKVVVLYIMGAGRSGSTLLDIVLGNVDGAFSCGEIRKFARLDGRPHGFLPKSECYEFWDEVRHRVKTALGLERLSELNYLHEGLESHRRFPSAVLRVLISRKPQNYIDYVDTLYSSISEISGKRILIDSSKYPARALLLSKFSSHDVYCISLTRSRSSVVKSFLKKGIEQPDKSALAANLYYFANRIMSFVVSALLPGSRVIHIAYENLVSNPACEMDKLNDGLPIDFAKVKEAILNEAVLNVGYLFEGNRIRLKKNIKLALKAA